MQEHELNIVEWAMKDSMRLEAIAFKKWCDENEDEINSRRRQTHSTEQLYELFKKENV